MARKSSKNGKDLGPWRVDGISSEAAAAATQAAERAGLSLEAWLSRVIRETADHERQVRERQGSLPVHRNS